MKRKARANPWRYFQVRVHGRNFHLAWVDEDGRSRVKKMGFITTVHVRARNLNEAELRAVNVLRRDKALLTSVRNPKSNPPQMFVENIQELQSFKGLRVPRVGFTFYDERKKT